MDNQKDSKTLNTQQNILPSLKSLNNNPIFEFVNKKTEKLITALYMVTDCMESEDALKNKLRFLGVRLLSDMYKLSVSSSIERYTYLQVSISKISEILSFVDISSTIGFISEMNAIILKREFNMLISELQSHLAEKQNPSFVLDEEMLEVEKPKITRDSNNFSPAKRTSYMSKRQIKDKRTSNNTYNFVFNKNIKDKTYAFNQSQNKEERASKIISIIKDKSILQKEKDGALDYEGIPIKEISVEFFDCSEKTIQRELNDLVAKGKLVKKGKKRWSRYCIQ